MPNWQAARLVGPSPLWHQLSSYCPVSFTSFLGAARMPVEIVEFEELSLSLRVHGDVTLEECLDFQRQVLADPRMRSGTHWLADCTGVTGAPSATELRTIACEFKPLVKAGLGPLAVVTATAFVYGVARMFCVFGEAVGLRMAVFHDFAEARE